MAAIFYSASGKDVFRGDINYSCPISVGFLAGLENNNVLTLITEVSIQTSETIQYLLSFDDLINYMNFGKGVGQINITGILFSDCNGNMPGASNLYNQIGAIRGNPASVSIGGYVFTGVISSSSLTTTSEPDTMAQFTVSLAMISHTLRGAPKRGSVKKMSGSSGASFSGGGTSAQFSANNTQAVSDKADALAAGSTAAWQNHSAAQALGPIYAAQQQAQVMNTQRVLSAVDYTPGTPSGVSGEFA